MTPQDAVDAMSAIAADAWVAAGMNMTRVVWDDLPGTVPNGEQPWARVTIRHDGGPTRAFGESGALYSNTGTLFMQIFTPMGGANMQARELAHAVVTAYRKARNEGVTFRNTRFKEVGSSGAFEQTNVLTDFSYDD